MMTNATVAEVKEVSPAERQLRLTYKEGEGEDAAQGEQVITVPDFVEVVLLAKSEDPGLIVPGRVVFLLVKDGEQGPAGCGRGRGRRRGRDSSDVTRRWLRAFRLRRKLSGPSLSRANMRMELARASVGKCRRMRLSRGRFVGQRPTGVSCCCDAGANKSAGSGCRRAAWCAACLGCAGWFG